MTGNLALELNMRDDPVINIYEQVGDSIHHKLFAGNLEIHSEMPITQGSLSDPKGCWWKSYLLGKRPSPRRKTALHGRKIRTLDLFSGSGGLANGIRHFADEVGMHVVPSLVVDQDVEATEVYAVNHDASRISNKSVSSLVDYTVRRRRNKSTFLYPPELIDSVAKQVIGSVDVVMAGPPCQGHSNLNNHTRRSDPRNRLYLTVPAITVAISAPICIIENVPAILHDSENVVSVAKDLFETSGYKVAEKIIGAHELGWPQTRRRHFLIAVKGDNDIPLDLVIDALKEPTPRSLWWAIGDLEKISPNGLMDEYPVLSEENRRRIAWLFENDKHDLNLENRPQSHRKGTTYQSVYGRMHRDLPAPTITTGFMSPGRGRFVHPTLPRTLTPREAGRIQGFPDTYKFILSETNPIGRSKLAKWIGDAVPMPLGYAAVVAAFSTASW